MNIIRIRQEDRLHKIRIMAESINAAENPDLDKLLLMACLEWGLSMRTAKEYLEIAKLSAKKAKETQTIMP